jgi:hypothetical protein
MNALAITAITDLLLASETFLLAGILLGSMRDSASAYGCWAVTTLLMAAGALLGGIDHGFYEPAAALARARKIFQKATWLCIGLMTFFIVLTLAFQFFPARYRVVFFIAGAVQLVVYTVIALRSSSFLPVILNYLPVLLFFLVMHILNLNSGRGSREMITGIALSLVASAVQAMKLDTFKPLDRNGLYHLIMMAASVFLFLGGKALRG